MLLRIQEMLHQHLNLPYKCVSCPWRASLVAQSVTNSPANTEDTASMDISLSKFRETVKDREAWRAAVRGVAKNRI